MLRNICKGRGVASKGGIVLLILFSILFSGCTWFGGEDEERRPAAILKNDGKNKAGNFVVRVDMINYPIKVRNVEIVFLDRNGTKITFSIGGNTTGVTLDQIYFSDYTGLNERNQVIYYDMDNDLRLAGTKANHTKDYFIIYPKLGAKDFDDPDYSIEGLQLILLWRNDDPYVPRDDPNDPEEEKENEGALIGSITLSENPVAINSSVVEIDIQEAADRDNKIIFGIVLIVLLCIIIIVVLYPKLILKKRKNEKNRKSTEKHSDSPINNNLEDQESSGDIAEEETN